MKPTYDVENFKNIFEHEFTWLNGFKRNVGKFPGKPALSDPETGRRWTYSQLNGDANRLANALLGKGAAPGAVIMYMLHNSLEFALCYIAGHKAGIISAPINFRLAPGEVAALLEDSKPEFFVYGGEFAATARKAMEMSAWKPPVCILAGQEGSAIPGEIQFDNFMAQGSAENPVLPEKPSIYDEKLRLYTSGTTSRAKGVPLNDVNEVLTAHDVIMHFPLTPQDKTMNMTPWFHRGGIHSGGLTPTLYAGGEVVVLREFNPKRCLEIAADEKVTFLIGVPSILALLARAQERQPVDLSALRGIITMGSPFDKKACEHYRELFTENIFNGYGTTETFWNTFLRPYNLPEMSGSAGQACTDDDVRVIRVSGKDTLGDPDDMVPRDNATIGEIIIFSPAKSTFSYFNNPEMTAKKFRNGFHYTGDLGVWDENGFVTVVSRKDDMIISAGENIYPTQIEAVLNEHPKVAESAVIGKPDRLHQEVVAAYIVPLDDSLTVEEIREWCVNHPGLAPFKRPRFYNLVKELPHTATGKLMHYKLREQAGPEGEGDR